MTKVSMNEEDLLVLSRRGQLDEEQRALLEAEVEASPELEVLLMAGLEFDRENATRPGDDELCRSIAESTLAKLQGRPVRSRRALPLWAAAGVLALSTAAAAGGYVWTGQEIGQKLEEALEKLGGQAPETPTQSRKNAAEQDSERRAMATRMSGQPPAALKQAPDSAVLAPVTEPAVATPSGAPSAGVQAADKNVRAEASALTAQELYEQANLLRRQGDAHEALKAYNELERLHPGASQTSSSRLAAAELLLRAGRSDEALARFSRYNGPLQAEAAWGSARALRALGRRTEEMSQLRVIQKSFAESAMAEAARARLQSLGEQR